MKTFVVLNFTRVALRKDVCVLFAILISKLVSRAIFDTQMVYFIRKLVKLIFPDREKCVFASFCAV